MHRWSIDELPREGRLSETSGPETGLELLLRFYAIFNLAHCGSLALERCPGAA